MKIETKCLHEGYKPENGGPGVMPIVQSTTYRFDSTAKIASLFDMPTECIYSRFANPTCDAVEKKIASLEGGVGAMLTSSGQAAIFVIGAMVFALIDEPEIFKKNTFIMIIVVALLGLMFLGMIAPLKGVWDICVDDNDVTVIKVFLFKSHWKISDISYCKMKRGGMNVYINGRKKKAFFVDAMTDHFDNFIKRMEKEGKEIIVLEPKELSNQKNKS